MPLDLVALAITALPIFLGVLYEHGPATSYYAYNFGRAVPFVFFRHDRGWAPVPQTARPWIGLGALITLSSALCSTSKYKQRLVCPRAVHAQRGSRMAMLTLDWGTRLTRVRWYHPVALPRRDPEEMRSRKLLVLALLAIVVAVATASFTLRQGC